MRVLVTGNAGFIGFHVARYLLERGDGVVGFDSVNTYYDPNLKDARLAELEKSAAKASGAYDFVRADLADQDAVSGVFDRHRFDRVIHLAAQAGIRHSISHPHDYVQSNLVGFTNILEACRHHNVPHLTYASTSSVYGANTRMPFSEHHGADHPLQFYAATKRANELMAHAYSHLYGLPTTGLRFFTVYGPWGRPDMALFLFTRLILAGEPIELFDNGKHTRDFTYIDDIVAGVTGASDQIAQGNPAWDGQVPDPATGAAPFRIFNIGNTHPVNVGAYVDALEAALGVKGKRLQRPRNRADVPDTHADVSLLAEAVGYEPATPVAEGVKAFVAWYRSYYSIPETPEPESGGPDSNGAAG